MNDDPTQNVVVELPPGGIIPRRGSHNNNNNNEESITESFTMVDHISQAESCMSSYVHVPSSNSDMNVSHSYSDGEWSGDDDDDDGEGEASEDDHDTDDRRQQLRRIQQCMNQMNIMQDKRGNNNYAHTRPAMGTLGKPTTMSHYMYLMKQRDRHHHLNNNNRKKKQKLMKTKSSDNDSSSSSEKGQHQEGGLSMIQEENEAHHHQGLQSLLQLPRVPRSFLKQQQQEEDIDRHNNNKKFRGTSSSSSCTFVDDLVAILATETARVPNLKLIHNLEDLEEDVQDFLEQAKKGRRTTFVGFKVAYKNQFDDIQSNGFDCGRPGFHLCKTIENAISFWQFQKGGSSSSSNNNDEHLWIVVGTEAPPSDRPTAAAADPDNIPHALPLACLDVQQQECTPTAGSNNTNNSADELSALVFQLKEWAINVS